MTTRIPAQRPPTHPGEMLLKEFLEPMDMSQLRLSHEIGVSYPRVNELVHGKRAMTPDTAVRLSKLLGTSPEFWMNLQQARDLFDTLHSPDVQKAVRTITPVHYSGGGIGSQTTFVVGSGAVGKAGKRSTGGGSKKR